MKLMNKLITLLLLILIVGCKSTTNAIHTEKVMYKDSIVSHIDTVFVQLPKETITDVVTMLDTLYLTTDVAEAEAYLDYSTKTLKGTLKNKGEVQTVVQYQDRYITRDSLVYVDRPQPYKVVEYKTPRWMIWYLILSILGVLIITIIKTKKLWQPIYQRILH